MKLKKGMRLMLDLETHRKIKAVQIAESAKFSLIKDRTKEEIAEDCVKLGIKEFIKIHKLEIRL